MAEPIVANWYRDPLGRGEYRYWDGQRWTEHIATSGRQLIDPPIASPPPATTHRLAAIPANAGRDDFADAQDGIVPLFREQVLIVKQKTKVFEVKAEYAIYDDSGRPLAGVSDVAASFTKRVFNGKRAYQDANRRLELVDPHGTVLMRLHRPNKFLRSKMLVTDGAGIHIGSINQKTLDFAAVLGTRVNFNLESGGRSVGSVAADDVNAMDCTIRSKDGDEVGVITRKWAAKSMISNADNYVVRIHRELEDPLRSLVVASVFAVDIALRQGSFSSA